MALKILYGVQGTGNGHTARARILSHYLAQHGAEVQYLFSGRDRGGFFNMEPFGNWDHREGLTLQFKAGRMQTCESIRSSKPMRLINDIRSLPVDQYDLVISDFEPITAWAAKRQNIPCIASGHQYALTRHSPLAGDSWLSRSILKYFAPGNIEVGQHWFPYHESILPPIIDTTLSHQSNEGFYLVYLPFEDQHQVSQWLNKAEPFRFVQYAPGLIHETRQNVECHPPSHDEFKQHLKHCAGVICNTGFELNSECIHMGIPILTKPVNGQMEQLSNAVTLKENDLATILNGLDPKSLLTWLEKQKVISPKPFPNVGKELTHWILNSERSALDSLHEQLWEQVTYINDDVIWNET